MSIKVGEKENKHYMYSVYNPNIYYMEETDMKDIKWAVLGTGVIANEMAVALKKNGRNIYAVGNRTYDKAVAFAEKYGIGKWIGVKIEATKEGNKGKA